MKFYNIKDLENKVPKNKSFKHYLRMHENGGRVVKGVNTTADVGVDAIKKQAAKFGNKVDKDGRPPTMSKKTKGSKTNVLFNLGLAESVDKTDESMLYYAKMAEELGEIASTSQIFVDMDGVLADFFGSWTKLTGKDWRQIKGDDLEPALQKIKDKKDFWINLPKTSNADNLLSLIKKVKGSYSILSSPLPGDKNSVPQKKEWIKNNLQDFMPTNVIIDSNKSQYATNKDGTPNILIDDYGKNIASWEAAGGIGFKHKDHKFERTAKTIKQHMSEPVEEDIQLKEWVIPAFRFGLASIKFLGRFIRRNPKTSLGTFSLPWTGPILASFLKGLSWLYAYSIPVSLGVVALYGGKKLYNVLKDKDPDTISEEELEEILKGYAPKSDKDLKKLKSVKENYARAELPQITKKDLKVLPHTIEYVKVKNIIPVQQERVKENFTKQLIKIKEGNYNPIVVDSKNKIINGHHRYDIIKQLKMEEISVARLPFTLQDILGMMRENFADGKKKGKSRPGRVKKSGASCNGSVTDLRSKAKKASGERAKMYHWCANMKSGRKKKGK